MESSWVQMSDKGKFQQEEGTQKDSKMVRCTSLNGSAWSGDKKYVRRYRPTFHFFSRIEHRMKKEEIHR